MEDFETLLEANRLGVERWVKFHVSGPDAEDVLQETYFAAYQAFPRLKDRTAFRPWLISIARNKWRDWYRKQAPGCCGSSISSSCHKRRSPGSSASPRAR